MPDAAISSPRNHSAAFSALRGRPGAMAGEASPRSLELAIENLLNDGYSQTLREDDESDRHSKVPSLRVGCGRVPTRQPQFGRPAVVMWPRVHDFDSEQRWPPSYYRGCWQDQNIAMTRFGSQSPLPPSVGRSYGVEFRRHCDDCDRNAARVLNCRGRFGRAPVWEVVGTRGPSFITQEAS